MGFTAAMKGIGVSKNSGMMKERNKTTANTTPINKKKKVNRKRNKAARKARRKGR